MIKKNYSKNGASCRVTFKLADVEADHVALLGDFNGWSSEEHLLKRRKDGTFSTTVSIPTGQEYRFRYLVDGDQWTNDEAPDQLVANRFGGQDGLLTV